MITYEFTGYALVWWNQFCREIREGRKRHVDTWPNLKKEIRTRFVPALYKRDLYNKLQRDPKAWKNNIKTYRSIIVSQCTEVQSSHYGSFPTWGHIPSQCPNKRTMVMKEDGIVESKSSWGESSSKSEGESSHYYSTNEGDLLMVDKHDNSQRENIFHSYCQVQGKLCSMIIDCGSNVNVASLRLVEKLKLPHSGAPKTIQVVVVEQ
ncbi:hypothetical protein CR513_20696, partial [Mucuna pruriens]